MKIYFSFVVLACFYVHYTSGLTCFKCDRDNCRVIKYGECKGGIGLDVCGCCPVCKKVLGEKCGGPWDVYGICDDRLLCVKENVESGVISENDFSFNLAGTCQCKEITCDTICRSYKYENGCKTCKCRHQYPKCRVIKFQQRRQYNRGIKDVYNPTVFCKRNCKRCCLHNTAYRPNRWYRYSIRQCRNMLLL